MTEAPNGAAPLQIAVHAQYIRDFSFECPNAPQIFAPTQAQTNLEMGVNVQTRPLGENNHECVLMLKLEASIEGKKAFIAELAYGGVFGLTSFPEDQTNLFMLIEAPRLLFPFARSILSSAIQESGFSPIMLNPIDFAALYQQHMAQQAAQPQASA